MRPRTPSRRSRKAFDALIVTVALTIPAATHAFAPSKTAASAAHPTAASASRPKAGAPARLLDINTASRAELKTLPGVGDAEAERIVAHRPYATKTHLVEKQVLGEEAYDKLRRLIVVEHRRGAASRPKARP
jgi:competence protein ComEA